MKKLQKTWITDGLLDFEYKKYQLLAYLKHVNEHFQEKKLFPELSDLQLHYQESLALQQQQSQWSDRIRRKLVGIDREKWQLKYTSEFEALQPLEEVDEILSYAIPRLEHTLSTGKTLFQHVTQALSIAPIGIMPLFRKEGYLFVYENINRELRIYQYKVQLFESTAPPSRRVETHLIDSRNKSYTTTFESIKMELVRKNKDLPNPASYLVESTLGYPMDETLLPIARQKVAQAVED
ncbi:hypothetical protein [Siphonobacter curvatus]|uniref:Uncharacterized protein n=1 Tax=Siphonobacter curvatus TaxID=2094562 RepID=A0A2S7IRG0_9BACT|nr:hypothetical protein [Siphonobacter curvatus]PQA60228.1 hypothetical protein C5O19_11600 [Siphonobacter curvatus]